MREPDPNPFPRLHLVAFGRVGGLVLERFLGRREDEFHARVIVEEEGDLPPFRARAGWHWPPLTSPHGSPSQTPKQFAHELGRANAIGWRPGDVVAGLAPAANVGTLSGVERLLAHAQRAECAAFFVRLGQDIGEAGEDQRELVDIDDLARKLAAEFAVLLPGIMGTDARAYLDLRQVMPPQGWSVGVGTARSPDELTDAARCTAKEVRRGLAGKPQRAFVTIGITLAAGMRPVPLAVEALEDALDIDVDAELNVEVLTGEQWEVEVGLAIASTLWRRGELDDPWRRRDT